MVSTDEPVVIEGIIRVEDSLRAFRYRNRKFNLAARLTGGVLVVVGLYVAWLIQEPDMVVPLSGVGVMLLPNLLNQYLKYVLGKTPQLYGEHELFQKAGSMRRMPRWSRINLGAFSRPSLRRRATSSLSEERRSFNPFPSTSSTTKPPKVGCVYS